MREVGHHSRRDVAQAQLPRPRQHAFHRLRGECGHVRRREQLAGLGRLEPAVGSDVEHTGEVPRRRHRQRGDEVVDVHDLHGERRAPYAQRWPAQQDAGGEALGAGPDHRRRP